MEIKRGNGKFLRNAHRRSKSTLSLKLWVRSWDFDKTLGPIGRQWFARKVGQ